MREQTTQPVALTPNQRAWKRFRRNRPASVSAIFLAALVWSVLVTVIRPILSLLTLPITIITFGLFSLVLNAILFYLMAYIVPGFSVASFVAAFLGAIVLSVLSWLIHQLL